MKILVVVDVQNDFITGALANPEAQKVVPNIIRKVEDFDCDLIIYTLDTHRKETYPYSKEGKAIPEHCILGSEGWELEPRVYHAMMINKSCPYVEGVRKMTFGSIDNLTDCIRDFVGDDEFDIEFVGFCTDICVVSNVLIVKAAFPNQANITVDSSCCAGLTPEKHEAALETMRSCLISVK